MKTDVYTLPASASVLDAVRLFVDKHISAAPLVDEKTGEAIGFVSDGDVMRYLSKRLADRDRPDRHDQLHAQQQPRRRELRREARRPDEGARRGRSAPRASSAWTCTPTSPRSAASWARTTSRRSPSWRTATWVGVINRSDITLYALQGYVEQREEAEEKTSTEVAAD